MGRYVKESWEDCHSQTMVKHCGEEYLYDRTCFFFKKRHICNTFVWMEYEAFRSRNLSTKPPQINSSSSLTLCGWVCISKPCKMGIFCFHHYYMLLFGFFFRHSFPSHHCARAKAVRAQCTLLTSSTHR